MNCSYIKEYIYPFLDGQLDTQTTELVKEHLLACPICSLELEQEKKLDSLIRNSIPRENSPYELKETILDRIRESKANPSYAFIFPLPKPVFAVALSLLFIAALIIPVLVNLNNQFPVFNESIEDHIQFLQGDLSIDIASSKSDEVHRWFQTKLDFKVMVPDLSSQGIELLGARLCAFKDKEVAYMIYGRNEHKLSVFMFDAEGMKFTKAKKIVVNNKIFYLSKEKGYTSVLWVDEGIACVFVADLDEAELLYLASL